MFSGCTSLRVSKCIQRDYYLYCSVCRAVRIHLRGCGSGGNRRNGNVICRCFNSLLYKEPFMAQISDTVSHTFTGCQRCPGSRFGGFRLCFCFLWTDCRRTVCILLFKPHEDTCVRYSASAYRLLLYVYRIDAVPVCCEHRNACLCCT